MSNHVKKYHNYSEFLIASKAMTNYQRIHNIIRLDYMELLNITELFKSNSDQFNALYRSCLKSLFSLIEADIFGLNNLDQYENYSDKHSFENKFKSTFTKVCTTWNKNEIREIYFDSKYCDLKELRKKRDELIHPKKVEHIHKATEQEFDKVKKVFTDYDNFINKLMDDFFIEAEVNAFDFINKITNTP